MRLKSFSVKDYRSIVRTERIALSDLTVLVGPNNEGKSNILQALVMGMRYLAQTPPLPAERRIRYQSDRSSGRYNWRRDFPLSKQGTKSNQRSVLEYVFEMDDEETASLASTLGHNINRDLPVTLTLGKTGEPSFSVPKQRVGPKMSARQEEITNFLREQIHVQYIPAVRSADQARDVVNDLVRRELRSLSRNEKYQEALEQLRNIEQPVIDAMERTLAKTLQELLPDVENVSLEMADWFRSRPSVQLSVDDGEWTDVALKGDGVQSLVALALMRRYAAFSGGQQDLVLAVEEPEAHLHPQGIHSLHDVLQEIAKTQQVIITTHSPLLVNRGDVASNVLVHKNRAHPARSIRELRDALGVRAADNLVSANFVLIVEGEKDKIALSALLAVGAPAIDAGIRDGALVVQPVGGAGNLSYVLRGILDSLCHVRVFLDNDEAGRAAGKRALEYGLVDISDITYAAITGRSNTELEDLIVQDCYRQAVLDEFNVDCTVTVGRAKSDSWGTRMRLSFVAQGQEWSESTEMRLKAVVAECVSFEPVGAVREECLGVIDAVRRGVEAKLTAP